MDDFRYRDGVLHCEKTPVAEIARQVGTPCYVYSSRTLVDHYRKLTHAFSAERPALVCYAVKANSCQAILDLMNREGAGFDVVSGGELARVLKIGAPGERIVFAGVGKTDEEIRQAIAAQILLLNVESEGELAAVDRVAGQVGGPARVALRVNPDIDPHTHRYISTGKRESKFGIDLDRALMLVRNLDEYPNVRLAGIHVHIGSQIVETEPYVASLGRVAEFLGRCQEAGHPIEWLDIGGGFGIYYKDKIAKTAAEMADALLPILVKTGCKLVLEPGRFIVGNAGILLTRVLYVKPSGDRTFVICDAGMNDLIRPALYEAYHKIWPVRTDPTINGEAPDADAWTGKAWTADIVGPVCETGDFFAKDRRLPAVSPGDLLSVFGAGAYGSSMASNYNTRPRAAEVVVSGAKFETAVRRETLEDMLARELNVRISAEA